jgi:hypothetical protein
MQKAGNIQLRIIIPKLFNYITPVACISTANSRLKSGPSVNHMGVGASNLLFKMDVLLEQFPQFPK